MQQILERKDVVARKPHRCDWCNCAIEKGELYDWSKHVFDGDFYEWHSHLSCSRVASAIWDYVDPDEGMTEDEFWEGCRDISQSFVCPSCREWDKETQECNKDESFCIDKLDEFFKTHELYIDRREGWCRVWKSREKKAHDR